uniref:MYND-type domain-containing protein n=1 Tax=Panagrellus redivivus TaxID=6233 RepID=A0A7E4WB01_PANRE
MDYSSHQKRPLIVPRFDSNSEETLEKTEDLVPSSSPTTRIRAEHSVSHSSTDSGDDSTVIERHSVASSTSSTASIAPILTSRPWQWLAGPDGDDDANWNPFHGFLAAAFSTLLALLLSWRIIFFPTRAPSIEGTSTGSSSDAPSVIDEEFSDHDDLCSNSSLSMASSDGNPEESSGSQRPGAGAAMRSVSTLLETDSLPATSTGHASGGGRPSQAPPPVPNLNLGDETEDGHVPEGATSPDEPKTPDSIIEINTFGVQQALEAERRAAAAAAAAGGSTPAGTSTASGAAVLPDEEEWMPFGGGGSGHGGAGLHHQVVVDDDDEDEPDFMVFGSPGLMQFMAAAAAGNMGFGYLDAITEEDSDDLRSQSSASSHRFGGSSARSSVRAPSADVVEQVESRISSTLGAGGIDQNPASGDSASVTSTTPVASRRDSGGAVSGNLHPDLLSEASESLPDSGPDYYRQYEQHQRIHDDIDEDEPDPDSITLADIIAGGGISRMPRLSDAYAEMMAEHQPKDLPPSAEPKRDVVPSNTTDKPHPEAPVLAERPESPEVELPPHPTAEDKAKVDDSRASSPSVSLNLDQSRDVDLDQSVCSNPRDETAILELSAAMSEKPSHEPPPPPVPAPVPTTTTVTSTATDLVETESVAGQPPAVNDPSFDEDNLPPPPPPPPAHVALNESTDTSSEIPPPPQVLRGVTSEPEEVRSFVPPIDASPEDEPVLVRVKRASEEDSDSEKPAAIEEVVTLPDPAPPAPVDEQPEVFLDASSEPVVELDKPAESSSTRPETLSNGAPAAAPPTSSSAKKPPGDISSPERLSSLLYGYNAGGLAPLSWQTRSKDGSPDGDKENAASGARFVTGYSFGPAGTTQPPLYSVEERTTFRKELYGNPLDVDLERSSKRLARYGPTYADAPLSYAGTYGMDAPPSEAPPPPPSQPATVRGYAESTGYRTDADTSRDDLMSDAGRRSRATIRDIPVQRSHSAFSYSRAPTTNGSMLDFRTPGAGGTGWTTTTTRYEPPATGAPGEEYYRREVMTRTLVTRSTEALSQGLPPITSSIDYSRNLPDPRDEVTEEYITRYTRSIEEEERRIREVQERRRGEEEERRRREDEIKRRFEAEENERLERIRRERLRIEQDLEEQILQRERAELERIERERVERGELERRRRAEWERLENERRALEEQELARRRELERIEKERLERERLEAERLERERLARERAELERIEHERIERERIERERLEIERLEIERIERIRREQQERERRDREREEAERARLEAERLEAERLEQERIERERIEREIIEQQRREAERRERERREDEQREAQRREQEARDRDIIRRAEAEAAERERQRRIAEAREAERLEILRREQERIERERQDAERRERERAEEERRERELLEAREAARKRREQERIEEELRERERLEQERRERERRERERLDAAERERLRQIEEQRERERGGELERLAAERRAIRALEEQKAAERDAIAREAERLKELERIENEKRERERQIEERKLAELKEQERRHAAQREQERREAAAREAARIHDDRRSRDRLDLIVKEREDRERWESERRRVLAEREAEQRRRKDLTSKETLERLTRKPYYSRENLSNLVPVSSSLSGPDITTKVERQVIERVDRTLYTSDGQPITSTSIYTGGGSSLNPPALGYGDASDDFAQRDRLFQSRLDDLRDSKRTPRYKSKLDKARRDFFSGDTSINDAPLTRKSTEDLNVRRVPDYRAPLTSSVPRPLGTDVDSGYPRVGPSPYDKEYQRLYAKAERNLAPYRKRTQSAPRSVRSSPPTYNDVTNISSDPRPASSLSVAADASKVAPTETVTTTVTESVNRSRSVLDYTNVTSGGVPSSTAVPERRGWYSPRAEGNHSRSKSADMLMDQKAREDTQAPENELQKQGSDVAEGSNVLEHELRFRKSLERMHVPDWYRDYSTRQTNGQTSVPVTRYDAPPASTGLRYDQPPVSSVQRYDQPPTSQSRYDQPPSATAQRYDNPPTSTTTQTQSRYESSSHQSQQRYDQPPTTTVQRYDLPSSQPWSYTNPPLSSTTTHLQQQSSLHRSASPPVGGISLPSGMFDRYKDEIEDMRRSRTSLHQLGSPASPRPQEHTKVCVL